MNTSRNNLSPCSLASLLADHRSSEYQEQEEQQNSVRLIHALILPLNPTTRN